MIEAYVNKKHTVTSYLILSVVTFDYKQKAVNYWESGFPSKIQKSAFETTTV